ncbi:MAG: 16S rRNA (uracil(1498)-N(3))-methyltransferase [Chlorobi bacterium]|nr:16S rRNA (uracil(1498)-N(3))-methyltransferase [Chlorobiota bacterium]
MELFYEPEIENTGTLNEQESRHCISVLRHKKGDEINVANGKGAFFKCIITNPHPKHCEVKIISKETFEKRTLNLHIAIAPTKNTDRTEWFAEKVTEIGIETITLLNCEHSERKKIRLDRLEKIIVSATKQSVKAYKPQLNELTGFRKFIDENPGGYIAHCNTTTLPHMAKVYKPGNDAVILIGPEGDFSVQEVDYALKNGYKEISLGNSRLRTETAGIVACTMFNVLNLT